MDVTGQTFATAVIERSKQVPVVVDFWAEWCGPCRQLGPVLERAVADRGGRIELVKVDTDRNPGLAQAFRIQGIPAVKAFKDGTVVSEFTGALPAPAVEQFLDGLLPSEADGLVADGDEAALRRALELEPGRADAAVPLAKLLYARGERDAAAAILENVSGSFAADGLLARIGLERDAIGSAGTTAADTASAGTPAAAAPELSEAFAALDAGQTERGIDLLIEAIPTADGARDEIRKVIVGVLDELGSDTDLARAARRRLSAALY